jgi:protein-disulfide isomerase
VSQPPSDPPPEGPEPSDDPPPGVQPPAEGAPPHGGRQPPPYGPPSQYGPPQYGPPQYGPPQYGPPPGGSQYGPPPGGSQYGAPPYGQPYGAPYAQPPGRSRRGLVVGLIAGFVVLVVCVTVTAVLVLRDGKRGTRVALPPGAPATMGAGKRGTPAALPPGVTAAVGADGTLTMAKSGVTRPLVDVFEDFQCPVCKEFHQVNDATLKNLAGEGKAKVVYHPIVIFTQEPLASNSTRASAAARCVTGGAGWLAFQDQLFLHQPPEGSLGFSAGDLVSYGSAAGAGGSGFTTCVLTMRYAAQVGKTSAAVIAGGLLGTPTVKVNGKALPTSETLTAEGLRNAVIAAG